VEPKWDDEVLAVKSDSPRTARYRRLQSWYREVQLEALPGEAPGHPQLGSMLRKEDVAAQRDLNFIHPAAAEHAETRAKQVQEEHGSLEVGRLRHNMLSSMPMCFNLFGTMRDEADFLAVFRELFDPETTRVSEIVCEWAGPGPDGPLIGDRTAFDAMVRYEREDGPAFCGIETKYTEPLSSTVYEPTEKYTAITADSGWFKTGASEILKASESNQLWRNVMLAAAHEADGRGRGSVAVVALEDDTGAAKAMEAVSGQLTDVGGERLRSVSLQSIVEAAAGQGGSLDGWADRFNCRYLLVKQPDDPDAGADESGPRLGRPLTKPG
jgi:hypothetical protein